MTAHIDDQEQETEECECDPHDVHKLQKQLNKSEHSKRGWIFLLAVSVFFNLIAIARFLSE